jgi:beta-glucosidase
MRIFARAARAFAAVSLSLCFVLQPLMAQTNPDVIDSDEFFRRTSPAPALRDHSQKIEALLKRMTLEEKVGQMTQLAIGMIASGSDQNIKVDPAKLEKAIAKYGVGSILNVSEQAITVDHWHEIIGRIQDAAKKTRLGIPVIYGIDSIHGANYVLGATLFPQEIGMAATFNPELMKRAAEITAAETRAAGIPWSFSPVLDLGRNPLWPRFWETFGEDPYVASVMGVAFVRGLEGSDPAAQTAVATTRSLAVGQRAGLELDRGGDAVASRDDRAARQRAGVEGALRVLSAHLD